MTRNGNGTGNGNGGTPASPSFFAFPGAENPYLLAFVRWPDTAQAISAGCPEWQHDQGLFDLPYHEQAVEVAVSDAAEIAGAWGADLLDEDAATRPVAQVIRRMPANWSALAPEERRAWGLDTVTMAQRAGVAVPPVTTPLRRLAERLAAVRDGRRPAERRAHERIRLAGTVDIGCHGDVIPSGILDISAGGAHCLGATIPTTLQVGEAIRASLVLEPSGQEGRVALTAPATVAWRTDARAGAHVGLAFGALGDDDRALLEGLLSVALSREPYVGV